VEQVLGPVVGVLVVAALDLDQQTPTPHLAVGSDAVAAE
jgi:hypothetical protein